MLARIRKAIAAGIGAALTGLITAAIQKGSAAIDWPEVLAALGLGLAAGLATWKVRNQPTPPAVPGAADKYMER